MALNAHAENVERELAAKTDELKNIKMKADVELAKAELDGQVQNQAHMLDARKIELDFVLKQEELLLQREQLAIEKAKLAMAGLKEVEKTERELDKQAMRFDALDVAQPSDFKASPTGL